MKQIAIIAVVAFAILLTISAAFLTFLHMFSEAKAWSPSFSRQEIREKYPGFWRIANEKQCPLTQNTLKQNAFPMHTMEEISYFSDGKMLNSTILLPQVISPPSHIHSKFAEINVTVIDLPPKNMTLDEFTNKFIGNLQQNYTEYRHSRSTLAANPAYHVEYVFNKSNVLEQWTVKGAKGYIISFKGDPITYSNNLQVVEKMISSFGASISPNKSSIFRAGEFLKYENSNHKISIDYPPDWQKLEYNKNNFIHSVLFTFPFSEPFHHILHYSMVVHPAVIYDPRSNLTGGNYRVMISLEDNQTIKWSTWTQEEFLDGYKRVSDKKDISSFFGKRGVPLSLNLSSVNFPTRYIIGFSQDDTFFINDRPCIMVDDTDWYTMPLPQYIISTSPSSVELRPLQEKDIELQIRSTNMVPSNASISVTTARQISGLDAPSILLNGSPNNSTISVPLEGTAISILHIKAQDNPENILPSAYPLVLTVRLNEQTPSPYFGKVTVATNSLTGNITQSYQNFTTTLLKPFSSSELFGNFWNSWGGLISFIGAGFTAGFAAMFFKKINL